jgi:cyclic pyranopterin phosphate synthase
MPAAGVRCTNREDVLTFEEIVRFVRIVKARFGAAKVRLTGGEPLVRPGIVDLVRTLAREGVPDLAMTTNGQHLACVARDLARAGLRRVNVSLDTLDADKFRWLTRGGDLKRTLDGIRAALEAGLGPVRLNCIVLRGVNDDEVAGLAGFAFRSGCQIRFLELMPLGTAAPFHGRWFVPSAEVRQRLSREFELSPLPGRRDSTCRDFAARHDTGWEAAVGFIASCTEPFCGGCNRLRLSARGELIGCLARRDGFDVRALLRAGDADAEAGLAEAIRGILRTKRRRSGFETHRAMAAVGG